MSERVDQAEVNIFEELDPDCFNGDNLESFANGYFEDLTKARSEIIARRENSQKSYQNNENDVVRWSYNWYLE